MRYYASITLVKEFIKNATDLSVASVCRKSHPKGGFLDKIQYHIWKDYEELTDDARHTPKYAEFYKRRKKTIERIFADAKEKHAMRYTPYSGLAQVSNWVKLKFAAMHLKKFAKRKWRDSHPSDFFKSFFFITTKTPTLAYA